MPEYGNIYCCIGLCSSNRGRHIYGKRLFGHLSINITRNLYIHVIDDEKKKEVEKIEKMLNVV